MARRDHLSSPGVVVALVFAWIPAVLLADAGAGLLQQRLLGVGTWALLLVLLWAHSPLVRAQTIVVICFATVIEYTFSPLLEVYVYRLDNVPAFVPPGHGLVYLAAWSLGASSWFRANSGFLVRLTVLLGGVYALWGVSPLAPRPDVLGVFWFLCLLGFLRWGRSRMLYVGAFAVVTYLEILGTWIGNWAWAPTDPTGLVSIGNPPTGAAGGYGWFDLVAMALAPSVVALGQKLHRLVVQSPVRTETTSGGQRR
jgi:hypothetical protein